MSTTKYPADPILIVDDEEGILLSIDTTLQLAGINNVITCADSRQVMSIVQRRKPGIILLDLNMPYVDGEAILDQLAAEHPQIQIIIITGRIDTDSAVECMKSGAFDYIVKPIEENRLLASVKKSMRFCELHQENQLLNDKLREGQLKQPDAFSAMVSQSSKMMVLFNYAESVAATSHPVLIRGETGTGKELLARAIHAVSGKPGEFIAINVAGLDDNVFSDTLFGHVKGAFTGAESDRAGLIERAADGTLFLDEIGDLNAGSQIKLLRLLQEKEYMPLGLDTNRTSNARIIASTHVNLWDLQQKEVFRQDLHYRLRTHSIVIPPLRDRKEDLALLADYFVDVASTSLNRKKPRIPHELMPLLENYHFPGNIRELQAMFFDAVAQNEGATLALHSFREHIAHARRADNGHHAGQEEKGIPIKFADPLPTIKQVTRMLVEEAMARSANNQSTAASMLGISQQALSKRLRQWNKED